MARRKGSEGQDKQAANSVETSRSKGAPATITLRNNCSHPVFFRVPGMTMRIGPRGTCEVEESILATAELSRLIRNRHVSSRSKMPVDTTARTKPKADAQAEGGPKSRRAEAKMK